MWEWINDKTKQWEYKTIIEPGNNWIKESVGSPVKATLKEKIEDTWVWFVDVLPDIAGYGVIAAGAIIMISPMVSGGGMLKPLAFLAGGLILTVCILMTN